jgi:DNA processing protein
LITNDNLKYIYFLTRVKNLGNIRIKNIYSSYKKIDENILFNSEKLKRIEGINEIITGNIIKAGKNFKTIEEEFEKVLEKAEKNNVKIICFLDDEYPANLKNIFDAPVILYCKGNLTANDVFSLSVVGTRYPTDYGRKACSKIVEELSYNNIPIISGMARGIDSLAHKTALDKNNVTYAILGCGIDVIYPPENKKLYYEIIEKGAVLTEYEFGAKPDKTNFPQRNRIISGIGIGTLIVETGLRGGSLITAEFALDQNKEVFAIPGSIYSNQSSGCNNLIKKGQAKLIDSVEDIFSELNYKLVGYLSKDNKNTKEIEKQITEMNLFEKSIYEILGYEPKHIDEINLVTGLSISDCLVNLLSLEFKGLIKQLPGKYFIKTW